eukprot:CAMPEP_0182487494 /NCGR_PEP_ID=MMETSP1319-20130603/47931_1 /TAXON_ID=172717 /ORGANISM="Bolidomonas pacifica, Strain RCC208" /LENGTH=115 /DNA_ID=CAMNT_0024689617 /DNA_START=1463 /DNA_END=1810 /DNA_ORIENTATION=+
MVKLILTLSLLLLNAPLSLGFGDMVTECCSEFWQCDNDNGAVNWGWFDAPGCDAEMRESKTFIFMDCIDGGRMYSCHEGVVYESNSCDEATAEWFPQHDPQNDASGAGICNNRGQ